MPQTRTAPQSAFVWCLAAHSLPLAFSSCSSLPRRLTCYCCQQQRLLLSTHPCNVCIVSVPLGSLHLSANPCHRTAHTHTTATPAARQHAYQLYRQTHHMRVRSETHRRQLAPALNAHLELTCNSAAEWHANSSLHPRAALHALHSSLLACMSAELNCSPP